MSLSQSFNTNASGRAATALPSPHALGLELLELTMRKQNGDAAHHDLNERAIGLIENGASLTVTDATHHRTPLMWASIYCRHRIIRAILDKEPDILQRDNAGKTALDLARQFKKKPAIELLEIAETKRRDRVLEEARDVATRQVTVIRKPLSLKKKPHGRNGQQ